MLTIWIGGLLTSLAAVALYLAAPNQQLMAAAPPRLAAIIGGLLLMAAGVICLLQWSGVLATVFIATTVAMTVWSILPLTLAWIRGTPEKSR